MSVMLESFTLTNPNHRASSMAFCLSRPPPKSLYFESLVRPHRVSISARTVCPTGIIRGLRTRTVLSFSASHEESKHSEIEVEEEKNDVQVGAGESQEAWKETLASFQEQALKMQSVSQEAYELYSKKAVVILKETSEKLKIQAEKARYDLSVIAKEISEEGKEYLSTAAEKSPEPVKDIVETFASSTDDVKDISKVRDFYLGIPYGSLLSIGGFLSFMLTGSVSAIRFGVILGGTLLALSIASLRSWRRGESFPLALKGQAAIGSILFLREIRMLFERPSFTSCFTTLFSGAMAAFYLYRIIFNGGLTNTSNLGRGTES